MDTTDRTAVTQAVRAQYTALTSAVEPLDDDAFLRGTCCVGWCVRDLLFHLLLDAQRALVALATPTTGEPDRDLVTYWADFRRGGEKAEAAAAAHARFVRQSSAAYGAPAPLVARWRETTEAVTRAADACPYDAVATQGHALRPTDLVGTLAVEACLHHLDLIKEIPDAPAPAPDALSLVRHTLDGLSGSKAPERWDDVTYASKGTGRLPLDDVDRAALGDAVDAFPFFG